MRTMNLDPFWRTSIGFDRLFDLMDESLRFEPEDHYPPCNIVRTGENTRLSDRMRFACFGQDFPQGVEAPCRTNAPRQNV